MFWKIAALSDIHIKKDRRNEYKEIFEKLYISLREENPDIIVVAGDIFDDKMKASPHNIEDVLNFFRELSNITNVIVITGNHDTNCLMPNSLDMITPLLKDNNFLVPPRFIYWRYSGIYEAHGIRWIVKATDGKFPEEKFDNSMPNVCLFHEEINGTILCNNTKLDGFSTKISDFEKYDLTIGGHIHRRQLLTPRLAYCGSLIQQNIGESHNGHGYSLWNLTNDGKIPTVEHIDIRNENGFVRIMINKSGDITELPIPSNPLYWEIFYEESCSKILVDSIREKYEKMFNSSPRSSRPLSSNDRKEHSILTIAQNDSQLISSHEDIIRQLLPEYQYIEEIIQLHKSKWNPVNVIGGKFIIKTMEFDNIYAYGPSNYINFENLSGCVSGVVAANHSGKSSIIDALLFVLYEIHPRTTSKKDIIHQGATSCRIVLNFSLDGKDGQIIKAFDHGCTSKTGSRYKFIFNGEDRTQGGTIGTLEEIRKVLGDETTALTSSFQIQGGENSGFMGITPSNRKKLISEVMSLGSFLSLEKEIVKEVHDTTTEHKILIASFRGQTKEQLEILIAENEVKLNEIFNVQKTLIKHIKSNRSEFAEISKIREEKNILYQILIHNNTSNLSKEKLNSELVSLDDEYKKYMLELKYYSFENISDLDIFKLLKYSEHKKYRANSYSSHIGPRPTEKDIDDAFSLIPLSEEEKDISKGWNQFIFNKLSKEFKKLTDSLTPFDDLLGEESKNLREKKGKKPTNEEVNNALANYKLIYDVSMSNKWDIEEYNKNKKILDTPLSKYKFIPENLTENITENIAILKEIKDKLLEGSFPSIDKKKLNSECLGCIYVSNIIQNKNEDTVETANKLIDINNLSKELAIKQIAKTKIEILTEAKIHYDTRKKVEMSIDILEIYNYHYSRYCEDLKRKTKLYEEISAMQISKKYHDKLLLEEKAINIIRSYNYWHYEDIKNYVFENDFHITDVQLLIKINKVCKQLYNCLQKIQKYNIELSKKDEIDALFKEIEICKAKITMLDIQHREFHSKLNECKKEENICKNNRYKEELEIENKRLEKFIPLAKKLEILKTYRTILKPVGGIGDVLLERGRKILIIQINNALLELGAIFEVDINSNYEVYIKSPNSLLPSGLGSGYQKFVLSLAARLAIWRLSTNPRPDAFIIDEGFGACDEFYLNAIMTALESLSTAPDGPKLLFLVSHVDLKNRIERPIEIKIFPNGSKIVGQIEESKEITITNDLVYCNTCKQNVKKQFLNRHIKSKKHENIAKKQ
jgi:DNA repair exonuclease SbcCD ATPase subunit/DNA repair exonuclease SbcCD nuclease subunit